MSSSSEKKKLKGKEIESMADKLQSSSMADKPDSKQPDLGSPVSPLAGRGLAGTLPATSTSSSSSGSFTGRNPAGSLPARSGSCGSRQSCEPSVSSPISGAAAAGPGLSRHSHRPSSSRSSAAAAGPTSPAKGIPPMGNICPSGKVVTSVSGTRSSPKSDVLGSGSKVNYGHGNIVRRSEPPSRAEVGAAPAARAEVVAAEEMRKEGNEKYKRGEYGEAIGLYEKAIGLWEENAVCRSNKAAALMGLGRLVEAVSECQEAVKVDPGYGRAHQRLAHLLLRFGHVELARKQMFMAGSRPEKAELQKLESVEKHMNKVFSFRKSGEWKSLLSEADATIAAGVDSSPQIFACRGEAFLKLHQLNEAESCLAHTFREYELRISSFSDAKFFEMLRDAYPLFVRAQIEMALGRLDEAAVSIEEAWRIDARNVEVSILHRKMGTISKSWRSGDELFKIENFSEAFSAYDRCLKLVPWNYSLLCKRAACLYKTEKWESAVSDCNHALRIHPGCTQALLTRARSNAKMERWGPVVGDYEILQKELPEDKEVEESLLKAKNELKKSRGKEARNVTFRGVVETVVDLDRFRAATSSPGATTVMVNFETKTVPLCIEIAPVFENLCTRYPSTFFLKVDVEQSREIAEAEDIRDVPTLRIYKGGTLVEEIISPNQKTLECCVENYSR